MPCLLSSLCDLCNTLSLAEESLLIRPQVLRRLLYYLLALNIAGVFFLVYGIVVTELGSRRERCIRERVQAAMSEIKSLQVSNSEQQGSVGVARVPETE